MLISRPVIVLSAIAGESFIKVVICDEVHTIQRIRCINPVEVSEDTLTRIRTKITNRRPSCSSSRNIIQKGHGRDSVAFSTVSGIIPWIPLIASKRPVITHY